jgi:hypothetical protein
MKKKNDVEMARWELAARVRNEANIVRARYLNEVGPAILEEFDRRLTSGESITIELPSADDMIADAIRQVESGNVPA